MPPRQLARSKANRRAQTRPTAVRKHKKAVRENAAKLERNRAMREYIKVTADMQRMHEKAMRELANRHARR